MYRQIAGNNEHRVGGRHPSCLVIEWSWDAIFKLFLPKFLNFRQKVSILCCTDKTTSI